MGNDKYILNEAGELVLEPDLLKWAEWFENFDNRKLASNQIGKTRVSTVFLGLDHSFGRGGPPVLWETMIFPGDDDNIEQDVWRYSSRQEAMEGHQKALELVLARKAGPDAPKSA